MDVAMQLRRKLKKDLRSALAAGEFSLAYQPIVALETGKLIAVEALLRWEHPLRGTVSPSDFIPIAEEMGVIGMLGDWALKEACAAVAEWPRAIRIAVNLSPLQLQQPGLVLDIVGALNRHGIAPSGSSSKSPKARCSPKTLRRARRCASCTRSASRSSLDDFGTGYSSLS